MFMGALSNMQTLFFYVLLSYHLHVCAFVTFFHTNTFLSKACHQCRAEVGDRQIETRAGLHTGGAESCKQRPAEQRNGRKISFLTSSISEKKNTN